MDHELAYFVRYAEGRGLRVGGVGAKSATRRVTSSLVG
jgi:hypothetical protein